MKNPLSEWTVTCPFGWRTHPVTGDRQFHNGVDLRAKLDTPIYAPFDGTVSLTSHAAGGRQLILTHPGGLRVGFAHLNRYAEGIAPGSEVKEGQLVAYSGQTGRVTGPHVHMTLAVVKGTGRKFYDPESVFPIY